jgi:uncharacterized protein (DUF1697 family)
MGPAAKGASPWSERASSTAIQRLSRFDGPNIPRDLAELLAHRDAVSELSHSHVPMPRYVALLRAINVGGHTVKMDRLRALFEALGFARVETFIASGNVIFESPETDAAGLERRIEAHLHASLGYAVATFLRTPAELASAAAFAPFPRDELEQEGNPLYLGFLHAAPAEAAHERLAALATERDAFALHGRELYWLARGGMGTSKITNARLEKALGMPATLRNVTTVRQLATRYAGD